MGGLKRLDSPHSRSHCPLSQHFHLWLQWTLTLDLDLHTRPRDCQIKPESHIFR